MNILPQIAQMTQRNAAGCIISQRKTGWGWLLLFLLFWVSSAIICVICERLQMADLFGRDTKTIRKHIHNAINEELAGSVVVAKFASTTKHGAIIF